jgi:CRISPR-associated exonuclease Cas4
MKITGTLIWYYFICKREVWLMSRQINAIQDNDFLQIGNLIHKESFKREKKEIQFGNIKFDIVKKDGKNFVVGEIKKSSHYLDSARMQLAFYLKKLKDEAGILAKGQILIPKEKLKIDVELDDETEKKLEKAIEEINKIIEMETPPELIKNKYCRNCAYKEFCWS